MSGARKSIQDGSLPGTFRRRTEEKEGEKEEEEQEGRGERGRPFVPVNIQG